MHPCAPPKCTPDWSVHTVCDNIMLTFRFVPFCFVYYTVLYSVLFRPLPFSFGEENNSNVRKMNTCVETVRNKTIWGHTERFI